MRWDQWQKNYQKYLQTNHWRAVRRKVWERDAEKCRSCQRQVSLEEMQCHHLSYHRYNRHGLAAPEECITLCRSCHARTHGHRPKDEKVMDRVLASIRRGKQV